MSKTLLPIVLETAMSPKPEKQRFQHEYPHIDNVIIIENVMICMRKPASRDTKLEHNNPTYEYSSQKQVPLRPMELASKYSA